MDTNKSETDSSKLSEEELFKVAGGARWYGTNDLLPWSGLVKELACPQCGWTQNYSKGDKVDKPNVCPHCGAYAPVIKEMYPGGPRELD